MSKDANPELELGELARLLEDPQVREFLLFYLRIREPDARAHLRRVVAEIATSGVPSVRLKDTVRRHNLRLGHGTLRRAKAPS